MFFKNYLPELEVCRQKNQALEALLKSIENHVATITFTPQGEILAANESFCRLMGYNLGELQGQHHRIFCDPDFVVSPIYEDFWRYLRAAESHKGTFLRRKKNGDIVWLEATYFPVNDEQGRLAYIYKLASDVTEVHSQLNQLLSIKQSLDTSTARIEFTPDGTIVAANAPFLNLMGYNWKQIDHKHHRMFCTEAFYREHPDFWRELARGDFKNGQFERKTARGKSVWLEATYNPIRDDNGRIVKIIKFANDITKRVEHTQDVKAAANLSHTMANATLDTAKTGSELLNKSVSVAHTIVQQVGETHQILARLNEQSKNISAIVATIRGIADQTNLLALNAAIEAARAGDQGRGFAVVADEVRQLAGRTAQSTVEIEEVVKANGQLTSTANQLMASVKQSAELSNEQIQQVSSVIAQIHQGAQQVSDAVSGLLNG